MLRIIMYYIDNGGYVNAAIFFVSVTVLFLALKKLMHLQTYTAGSILSREEILAGLQTCSAPDKSSWLFKTLVKKLEGNRVRGVSYYENHLKDIFSEHLPLLNNSLSTMSAFIGVAPLLGLFGTVIGMIETFRTITEYGVGNPNILSEGISVALITTQSGLLVAFPCLLIHNFICSKKDMILKQLIADGEHILLVLRQENN